MEKPRPWSPLLNSTIVTSSHHMGNPAISSRDLDLLVLTASLPKLEAIDDSDLAFTNREASTVGINACRLPARIFYRRKTLPVF